MGNPNKIMDSLLVISYRTGDKKALALLVERWNKKICIQAFRYTNDWESAKDVTQDTWRTIIAKIHLLRDTNGFGSWALTIVSRKALDVVKKRQKYFKDVNEAYLENRGDMEDSNTNEQKIQEVMKALSSLPVDQRVVLKLFYLEEYSLKEISAITKVSTNTVKTRLFRAREKMKEIIKK